MVRQVSTQTPRNQFLGEFFLNLVRCHATMPDCGFTVCTNDIFTVSRGVRSVAGGVKLLSMQLPRRRFWSNGTSRS